MMQRSCTHGPQHLCQFCENITDDLIKMQLVESNANSKATFVQECGI